MGGDGVITQPFNNSAVATMRPGEPMIRRASHSLTYVLFLSLVATASGQCCRQSALPSPRELERFGLERAWWSQATLNVETDLLLHLTADEELLYAQSRTGIVTAFDAETGERLWSRLLGTPEAPSFPVATNSDQLVLATGMNLFALDKFNGKLLWRLNLPTHPSTAPEINDLQVYVGALDGTAYAFDLATIRQLFEDQLLPDFSDLTTVWRFRAGGAITSPPVAAGARVIFASEDGSVYSVNLDDGNLRFQFQTNGPIQAPMGRSQDALFIASDDVRFFCINLSEDNQLDGRLRWTFVSGLPILKKPRIVGQQVFITPERSGMTALSVDRGKAMWRQTKATDFLAASDQSVYASDDTGNVLILSRFDGAITGALPLREMSVRVNNDRTDRIYLATQQGLIMCLREIGADFPRYHKFPERQPMLPEFTDEQSEVPEDVPANQPGEGDPAAL